MLMISDGNKWNCLAATKLSPLLNEITSKHKVTFYCLNSLHLLRTKNKKNSPRKLSINHGSCDVVLPVKGKKAIRYSYASN